MNAKTLETQQFLQLSVKLTAFSEFQLQGTGQLEEYYDAVYQIIGEKNMIQLLTTFDEIQDDTGSDEVAFDKQFRAKVLSDEKLGPITRSIIKLWFVGTWYQLPKSWNDTFGLLENDKTYVISPSAYKEGLLWPTIGSHPMGAKAPGYGTWSAPPEIPAID
ncbi:hypothetical protein [Flammeovirga sp. SJP92]|uniref:hypothetical protein n=1 Tax=Flammeovirga sp. SJP92 TaxID=1775430 RepID=UPI0007878066|nr:hypothetical protein [Flammeovirga sp. SJP92]KXX68483.1 hypothetical protein AVL50_22210 [Flammeovirga sp. SJP92]